MEESTAACISTRLHPGAQVYHHRAAPVHIARYLIIALSPLPYRGRIHESQKFTMPKKNDAPASFETALSELEQIVTRLESGDLPLEEALNEFERGVQLARQGQVKLQQAEQRVQILLSDSEDAKTTPFTPDAE